MYRVTIGPLWCQRSPKGRWISCGYTPSMKLKPNLCIKPFKGKRSVVSQSTRNAAGIFQLEKLVIVQYLCRWLNVLSCHYKSTHYGVRGLGDPPKSRGTPGHFTVGWNDPRVIHHCMHGVI